MRVNILPGSKLSFLIHVISLPGAPHQNVTFENAYGITLAVNASRISASIFPYTSHGKVVNVNGYEMDVMLRNVSNEWISNVTVYVSNSLGKRGYFMIPDNKTLEHHPNGKNKHFHYNCHVCLPTDTQLYDGRLYAGLHVSRRKM